MTAKLKSNSKILAGGGNIDGVEISIFVREDDGWTISLRSSGKYPVNEIAYKFNGGGHMQASGCECRGKLKVIIQDILKECQIALGENNVW